MSNARIPFGLLIEFDSQSNTPFTILHNSTDQTTPYVPASVFANSVLTALNNIYNSGSTGQALFQALLSGNGTTANFAIGSTLTSFTFDSSTLFDYDPPIGPTVQNIRGINFATADVLGIGDNVTGGNGLLGTTTDALFYLGEDGAYHSFSAERVIVHELSHNILNTRDLGSLSPEELIDYQNENVNYLTNSESFPSAIEVTNQILSDLGEVPRLSYLGLEQFRGPSNILDEVLPKEIWYINNQDYSFTEGNIVDHFYAAQDKNGAFGDLDGGLFSDADSTISTKHLTGDVLILGRSSSALEQELIFAGAGDDYIYSDEFFDISAEGNFVLGGLFGNNDFISAGEGKDNIYAGVGDDILTGGDAILAESPLFGEPTYTFNPDAVSDRLEGGNGNDLYIVGVQFVLDETPTNGSTFISEVEAQNGLEPDTETLYSVFEEFPTSSLTFNFDSLQGVDVIRDTDGNGSILVSNNITENQGSHGSPIERTLEPLLESDSPIAGNYTFLLAPNGTPVKIGNLPLYELEQDSDTHFSYTSGLNFVFIPASENPNSDISLLVGLTPISDDSGITHHVTTFVIENFQNGNFGINIEGLPPTEPPEEDENGDQTQNGTDNADYLIAAEGNDVVNGLDGSDILIGQGGNDTLNGGGGNDYIDAGSGNDFINGGAGGDRIDGGTGNDTIDFSSSNEGISVNLSSGEASGGDAEGDRLTSIENVNGSSFNDTFIGSAGANIINGGAGFDTVDYSGSNQAVTIDLSSGTVTGGDATGDQLISIENIIGTQFDDTLIGNSSDNTFGVVQVSDTINGGAGSDTVSYEDSVENGQTQLGGLTIDLVNETVSGLGVVGNALTDIENVTGTFNGDIITGNDEDNILNGLIDTNDTILGNGGNDTIYVDGISELNRSDGGTGDDTVIYRHDRINSFTYNLGSNNYENFIIDEASRNTFIRVNGTEAGERLEDQRTFSSNTSGVEFNGFGGDDILIGGSNNDIFDGGTGNDFIDGGAGRDRVLYGNNQGQFIVNLAAGSAVFANGEIDQLLNIEDVTIQNGDNTLIGNDADNTIRIGNGNDSIFTGAGDDTVVVQSGGGTDTLNGETGIDTIQTTSSLGNATVNLLAGTFSSSDGSQANIFGFENVTTGNGNDLIIGSDVSNTISANDGDDQIFAGGGDDLIIDENGGGDDLYDGGAGSDTVDYSDLGLGDNTGLSIDLVSGVVINSSDNEQDTLLNVENIIGGFADDFISGSSEDNTLDGFLGDDTIFGLDGDDTLIGNDGADSLQGGAGNDTIIIDEDDIWYSGDEGIDTLIYVHNSSFNSVTDFNYALDQGGFENAEFGAGDDTIYGGESDNSISGGAGNDTLFGFGGDDTLIGGEGSDSLQGGDGNDRIVFDEDDSWWSGDAGIDTAVYVGEGNITYALDQGGFENAEFGLGNDTIYGGAVDNNIQGGAGDDTIFGYGGSDTIIGGLGNDSLYGGVGADIFIFSDNSGHDAVLDFENGLDVIDLSSHSQITDFSDVLGLATQIGSDVIIDFGNGSTIGLVGVDLSTEIDQSDFLFA